MAKLKPIEQIAEDVKNGKIKDNEIVMLKLQSRGHYPVGYIWNTLPQVPLKLYQTSGMATTLPNEEICKKIDDKAVNISRGNYLGYPILGYEIIGRAKKR